METHYDVIVIGGGHAGAEAAWAAARIGVRTALVAFDASAIGRMSCNPAIGGIGKGQIVREIDALGGLMALATDAAGIQFRTLNQRKGPAVQAPRAQCDRHLYERAVQRLLRETPNLDIIEAAVDEIVTSPWPSPAAASADTNAGPHAAGAPQAAVRGVRLGNGRTLTSRCAVVTTGTFLRAIMHCGPQQTPGGRVGEKSAVGLSENLRSLGLELARLKTGTPPRIARDTIDYGALAEQPGDDPPRPFSFMTDGIANRQVCCWITHTNETAHELIRANLHRAPMYSGQIQSRGPRYCPSIEDKVVRFAHKSQHQIFLEPEGYDSDRIYCNGISTSLPPEVQEGVVRSIRGLEQARVLQWGYAVEYDFVPPHQTQPTLETKCVAGLFLAGQINGTSGYEEAGGQGIVAGINAARQVLSREPLILARDASYIGVMIDDLVTRGTTEPYRMFTSRAEHRLSLRSDNADVRLTPIGRAMGLVDDARWNAFQAKQSMARDLTAWLAGHKHEGRSMAEWLRRPDFDWQAAVARTPDGELPPVLYAVSSRSAEGAAAGHLANHAIETVISDHRYAGYLRRQAQQVERMAAMDLRRLAPDLDYHAISSLRAEARERFSFVRPHTLGQARRISGITPADIALLALHLDRRMRTHASGE